MTIVPGSIAAGFAETVALTAPVAPPLAGCTDESLADTIASPDGRCDTYHAPAAIATMMTTAAIAKTGACDRGAAGAAAAVRVGALAASTPGGRTVASGSRSATEPFTSAAA